MQINARLKQLILSCFYFALLSNAALDDVNDGRNPEYLLCYSEDCDVLLGVGRITRNLKGAGGELKDITLSAGNRVRIYGKHASPGDLFWLVEFEGVKGLVDSSFIKVLQKSGESDIMSSDGLIKAVNPFFIDENGEIGNEEDENFKEIPETKQRKESNTKTVSSSSDMDVKSKVVDNTRPTGSTDLKQEVSDHQTQEVQDNKISQGKKEPIPEELSSSTMKDDALSSKSSTSLDEASQSRRSNQTASLEPETTVLPKDVEVKEPQTEQKINATHQDSGSKVSNLDSEAPDHREQHASQTKEQKPSDKLIPNSVPLKNDNLSLFPKVPETDTSNPSANETHIVPETNNSDTQTTNVESEKHLPSQHFSPSSEKSTPNPEPLKNDVLSSLSKVPESDTLKQTNPNESKTSAEDIHVVPEIIKVEGETNNSDSQTTNVESEKQSPPQHPSPPIASESSSAKVSQSNYGKDQKESTPFIAESTEKISSNANSSKVSQEEESMKDKEETGAFLNTKELDTKGSDVNENPNRRELTEPDEVVHTNVIKATNEKVKNPEVPPTQVNIDEVSAQIPEEKVVSENSPTITQSQLPVHTDGEHNSKDLNGKENSNVDMSKTAVVNESVLTNPVKPESQNVLSSTELHSSQQHTMGTPGSMADPKFTSAVGDAHKKTLENQEPSKEDLMIVEKSNVETKPISETQNNVKLTDDTPKPSSESTETMAKTSKTGEASLDETTNTPKKGQNSPPTESYEPQVAQKPVTKVERPEIHLKNNLPKPSNFHNSRVDNFKSDTFEKSQFEVKSDDKVETTNSQPNLKLHLRDPQPSDGGSENSVESDKKITQEDLNSHLDASKATIESSIHNESQNSQSKENLSSGRQSQEIHTQVNVVDKNSESGNNSDNIVDTSKSPTPQVVQLSEEKKVEKEQIKSGLVGKNPIPVEKENPSQKSPDLNTEAVSSGIESASSNVNIPQLNDSSTSQNSQTHVDDTQSSSPEATSNVPSSIETDKVVSNSQLEDTQKPQNGKQEIHGQDMNRHESLPHNDETDSKKSDSDISVKDASSDSKITDHSDKVPSVAPGGHEPLQPTVVVTNAGRQKESLPDKDLKDVKTEHSDMHEKTKHSSNTPNTSNPQIPSIVPGNESPDSSTKTDESKHQNDTSQYKSKDSIDSSNVTKQGTSEPHVPVISQEQSEHHDHSNISLEGDFDNLHLNYCVQHMAVKFFAFRCMLNIVSIPKQYFQQILPLLSTETRHFLEVILPAHIHLSFESLAVLISFSVCLLIISLLCQCVQLFKPDWSQVVSRSCDQISLLQEQLVEKDRVNAALTLCNANMSKKIKCQENEISHFQSVCDSLTQNTSKDAEMLQGHVLQLEGEVKKYKAKSACFEQEIKVCKEELQNYIHNEEENKRQFEIRFRNLIREKEIAVEEKVAMIQEISEQRDQLRLQIGEYFEQINELKSELAGVEKHRNHLENNLRNQALTEQSLRNELRQLKVLDAELNALLQKRKAKKSSDVAEWDWEEDGDDPSKTFEHVDMNVSTNSKSSSSPSEEDALKTKIDAFFDSAKLRADLQASFEKVKLFETRLEAEAENRKLFEKRLDELLKENSTMKENLQEAEEHKEASERKLEVLMQYFKEREVEFKMNVGKELIQKDMTSSEYAAEKIRREELENELVTIRDQVKDLKQKLSEGSRQYNKQLLLLEKRCHESWLNSRAAEREIRELKEENLSLRQKLYEGGHVKGKLALLPGANAALGRMLMGPSPIPAPGTAMSGNSSPSPASMSLFGLPPMPPPGFFQQAIANSSNQGSLTELSQRQTGTARPSSRHSNSSETQPITNRRQMPNFNDRSPLSPPVLLPPPLSLPFMTGGFPPTEHLLQSKNRR